MLRTKIRCKYCVGPAEVYRGGEWRCESHDVTIQKLDGMLGIPDTPEIDLRDYMIEMANRNLSISVDWRDRLFPRLAQGNPLSEHRIGTLTYWGDAEKMVHGKSVDFHVIRMRDVIGGMWEGYSTTAKLAHVTMRMRTGSLVVGEGDE
jgi:hypothetical protein